MNGWPLLSGKFDAILAGEPNWQGGSLMSQRTNLRKKQCLAADVQILPKS